MQISERQELYTSSNGDRWELGRDNKDRRVVIHTPNAKSGGTVSITDISAFLALPQYGPEHQALMAILHAETG